MEDVVGKIIEKYPIKKIIWSQQFIGFSPIPIKMIGYKVLINKKIYDITTSEDCDLPIGANVKLKTSEFLRQTFIQYEDKEFPLMNMIEFGALVDEEVIP